MVFCCDDEILHSGFPRHFRPCFGIEQIRIEMIEILLVIFIRDLLMVTDPFMPCGHGVESPVNKLSLTNHEVSPFPNFPMTVSSFLIWFALFLRMLRNIYRIYQRKLQVLLYEESGNFYEQNHRFRF